MLAIPTETKNAWIFGFSRSRALLLAGFALLSALLIVFAIIFYRETTWAQKIENRISMLLTRPAASWSALVILTLALVLGEWLISQWSFAATDQQLSAYLQRLTAPVLFTLLICVQGLILLWVMYFSVARRRRCLFTLSVFGSLLLLQWLFVGEFHLADRLYPDYYVAERYGESLQRWLPWILLQTAFFIQLPYLIRDQLGLKLNYGWIFLTITIIVGYFYLNAAAAHASTSNTDLSLGDQDVYVDFIRKISLTDFNYTGTRNQTPGYPYLVAVFCRGDMEDDALFQCGKETNIYLSLVLIFLIFWVFRRFLTTHQAFTLTLVVALSIFIFKAPYLKAELVFYFASFICFLLMSIMLIRPSISLGVATGIALGLTHLIKASILPGLALFAVLFVFRLVWLRHQSVRSDQPNPNLLRTLVSLGISVLGFIMVIFPYILESKQIYGSYLYNVNTSYYIWYDTWTEAKQQGILHGFEVGPPDLPADQIPGPWLYLQTHTPKQIIDRFSTGLLKQIQHLVFPQGVFNYLLLYLGLLVIVFVLNLSKGTTLLRQHFFVIAFAALYALGYTILNAWYFPIAGGPRFITGLFIPLLFSSIVSIRKLTDDKHIHIGRWRIDMVHLFEWSNAIIIAILMMDAYITFTRILPYGYFGS